MCMQVTKQQFYEWMLWSFINVKKDVYSKSKMGVPLKNENLCAMINVISTYTLQIYIYVH